MMKKNVLIMIFLILVIACSKPQVKTEIEIEPDTRIIAHEIFSLINQERQKRGLYQLIYDEKLADVALIHSRNMAEQGFLSHKDREGRNPQERVETYYPEIIFGVVGENIGYTEGIYREGVAKHLMQTWMNSSDLRANILSNQFSHMGAGIEKDGSKYFGSIKFISAVVKIPDGTINEVAFGSEVTLRFEFVGHFDRHDIALYCQFPDITARYYTSDNRFYTGIAPLIPEWIDHKHFLVSFKFDKGRGAYTFKFGKEGDFYPRGYTIVAN